MRDDEKQSRLHAKALRKSMTAAEARMWSQLRRAALGVKFRRQHPIRPFIADFACLEKRLVVELDGSSHWTADAARWDQSRTRFLMEQGWRVVRFGNESVRSDLDSVIAVIRAALAAERQEPQPPPALRATSPASGGGDDRT
jgi:very-short-patch-repair endonuclease